ncbi:MAG: GNAT family N-acetyltransferase [Clostridia bacterium]|nr:GNAT family N-acetyltransferase [Clostridia bacterium]
MTVDMTRFYREEDLFPLEFTGMTERPWGILFHNEGNRDSYDSNHALIIRDQVDDLPRVLQEITDFYLARGLHPVIYQSILDSGWFGEIAPTLAAAGYRSWLEEQTWMALTAENAIVPDPAITVRQEPVWQDAFATHIFEAAGEPWEIPVVRRQMENPGTRCFVAYLNSLPAGMIYGHVSGENVCRVDYLLTATAHRGKGVGRALTHAFVEHVKASNVDCVLWPDGDTPRRIYEAAGFRPVETRYAGRASWRTEAPEA